MERGVNMESPLTWRNPSAPGHECGRGALAPTRFLVPAGFQAPTRFLVPAGFQVPTRFGA